MKVTAVMVVRNEADILATTVRYHRARGVDEVLIVDNGSSDGTLDVLRRLAGGDPAVRWSSQPGDFHQADTITGLAGDAHAGGADWVLPTDADEFWWSAEPLRSVLERHSSLGALHVEVITFIQDRSVHRFHPSSLRSMRWRPAAVVAEPEARPEVIARRLSFLEMRYPPKYASRASAELTVHAGNHHVDGQPGERQAVDELVILHAAIRSRAQLVSRVEHGRRLTAVATTPDQGWHVRRLVDVEADGVLDDEWAACSAADGALDVYGQRHPVVADARLAEAVASHVAGDDWGGRLGRRARRLAGTRLRG
jgi:hypothetical protein